MKNNTLTVDARELAGELAWIAKHSGPSRGASPALSAVHVSALVGALQLRRTDYAVFAESSVYADGGGQAAILVDPAKLGKVLKGERGDAALTLGDTELAVTLGGRTVKLRAAAALDDYPQWPVFVEGDTGAAILSTEEVARSLTSAGEDSTLPQLTGVRFEDCAMVSTDRFRLTRINYNGCGKPMAALVPAAALRAFTRGDELVTVEHGSLAGSADVVHIFSGQRSIIAGVLNHEFPKWRQLLPDTEAATVHVVLQRDNLLTAIAGTDDGHHITLTVTAEGIKVVDADRDGDMRGEQQVPLVGVMRGDGLPFTVRLSAKLLKECLKGTSAVLHFEATTPHKAVLLRALTDNELHMIMPLKIPA
jgi:DNA polymerase III sliding clamp (beta) subunit (PCNA family)